MRLLPLLLLLFLPVLLFGLPPAAPKGLTA